MPLTEIGNSDWNWGFDDGMKGVEHRPGKGEDYDNGYARGYETSEKQSANSQWFEDFMKGKVRI
mgnify:CR=1 FL=1